MESAKGKRVGAREAWMEGRLKSKSSHLEVIVIRILEGEREGGEMEQ